MMIENKENRKFPISFNPQEWENYVGASCYLYALNIFKDEYILVGDMIGKRCEHEVSDETLIKVLKEELEYIGYELKKIDKECVISNNKYKICLMRDPRTGFYHFLREESDGNWTHKQPGELPQVFQMNKINNSDLLQSEPFRKRWYFEIGGKSYE